ncbi:MAG TPA: TMEM165/GDT1 family protein [Burkholderiaceae bacterium]|nr:TMEM165/GDT1 family protein [Burkholderiaceae bacterium]
MEALLVSTGVVALGEIGDKTQLLALVLAARYRQPLPIVAGIAIATLANHALAAAVGEWIQSALGPQALRHALGLGFIAMAAWALIPDRLDDEQAAIRHARWGMFGVTLVSFFLAEIGDKTQIATVMLAARFGEFWPVVVGTTAGMLIANVPVVLLGRAAAPWIPMRAIRWLAAVVFAGLGGLVLLYGTAL